MTALVDFPRLRDAHDLLSRVSAEARLIQLRNLVINNGGIWTVPDIPGNSKRQPVLYEAGLFGVPAIAEDPADLPKNWLRAARNVLAAEGLTPC